MQEKKQTVFKTPDITKMQEVVINARTKLYIAIGCRSGRSKKPVSYQTGSKRKSTDCSQETSAKLILESFTFSTYL